MVVISVMEWSLVTVVGFRARWPLGLGGQYHVLVLGQVVTVRILMLDGLSSIPVCFVSALSLATLDVLLLRAILMSSSVSSSVSSSYRHPVVILFSFVLVFLG